MTDEKEHFGRRWMLFSMIGYGLGGFIGWAIWAATEYLPYTDLFVRDIFYHVPNFVVYSIGGAVAGTLVGVMQWRVICLKSPEMNKAVWMAGNIEGMMMAWVLFFKVFSRTYQQESFILPVLAGGIAWGVFSGITQWYLLKAWVYRPVIFVLVSILIGVFVIGIGFAWIPPVLFGYMSNSGSDIFGYIYFSSFVSLFTWPLAGLLGGILSGSLLVWSLKPSEMRGEVVV